jgi:hypothetical protein
MPSPDKEEEEASLLEQGLANLEQLDVMENDERKAGAGGKAAVDLPKLAVAEDGQVMVLLDQDCISELCRHFPKLPVIMHTMPALFQIAKNWYNNRGSISKSAYKN